MQARQDMLNRVRAALEHEAHLDFASHSLAIDFHDGVLILEGEVPDIATKKLALGAADAVPGVSSLVDRLRLATMPPLGDGAIRDAVCAALAGHVDFQNCTLKALVKGQLEVLHDAGAEPGGAINVAVEDGVVTLGGHVLSLSHRRLAGVLAWWARGCRDVCNLLEVQPDEADNDDEVSDALRLVLETDPQVNPDQIRIDSHDYVVTLSGVVATEEECRRVEQDAWYVHGVKRVVNRLDVRP
ncbi:MAG: BON domain-containing protein [Zoogloea sp.]|nr:BON domain-containing protein [Zoogloea sp.]